MNISGKSYLMIAASLAMTVGCVSTERNDGRVITYVQWNIGHFAMGLSGRTKVQPAESAARAAEYRAFMRELNADVIGISEFEEKFDKGGTPSRTTIFGDYDHIIAGPDPNWSWQWNALAARGFTPVTNSVNYYQAHCDKTYFLDTVWQIDGQRVHFVQSHLDWNKTPQCPAYRRQQIAQLIKTFRNEPYVIISADFNVAYEYEWEPFKQAGFELAVCGRRGPMATIRKSKNADPNRTAGLDNVIVKGFAIDDVEILDRDLKLSDHMAVKTRLRMLPPDAATSAVTLAATGPWDVDLSNYPRFAGETGDSARIMRAVAEAGEGGVVWFPKDEYAIDSMLEISNQCSLLMHKSAHLKAVKEMPFVFRYFGGVWSRKLRTDERCDHNLFIKGGDIDGNGIASCANVMGLRHFTLADTTYRNGKKVGLQLGDPTLPRSIAGGYEIIANNLYFICNLPGMAGNVGLFTDINDSHFTDIIVVDYTVGIRSTKGANRYTRCHVWGGCVKKTGTTEPEYLPNSIAFDLMGGVLSDCYADTAMIGYKISLDARIANCSYFNNWMFKMDNPVVFEHNGGTILVTGGYFSKNSPHSTVYRRGKNAGRLIWRDNHLLKFTPDEMRGLNAALNSQN